MISQHLKSNQSKRRYAFILFCFFAALSVIPVYGQSKFEGKITFSIKTQDGQEHTMDYFVKGNRARINVDVPGTPDAMKPTIIFDNQTKMMYTLIRQLKSYMEFSLDSLANKEETKYDNMLKPHRTGKTKMIAGVKCEEWTFQDSEEKVTLWNAPNFGNFVFATGPSQPSWAKEIMKKGFFPFQVINHDANGNNITTLEVTKVDREKLDSSMFEIPAGYTKMSMPIMQN